MQLCALMGIRQVVLSPGSRSAPLSIAFARHPRIQAYTFSDERSAAFVALGMARQSARSVALVCTSGSAAYNYAPAIAEAFFQQIPLLVFTADRPPEWIDQLDGQTIRQRDIYGRHVKTSYELPVGQSHEDVWFAGRQVAEAINLSGSFPAGPVHINVPLREPFYPAEGEELNFDSELKVIRQHNPAPEASLILPDSLLEEWHAYEKKLIVGGQHAKDDKLLTALSQLSLKAGIPVAADIISNMHGLEEGIRHADIFLAYKDENLNQSLRPELLITYGLSVISKNLKLFLRKYRPVAHWHIQPSGTAADTFQSLSRVIHADPTVFFHSLSARAAATEATNSYHGKWQVQEKKASTYLEGFFGGKHADATAGEFQAVREVMCGLPDGSVLHLANSMAVRYANLIGLDKIKAGVEVVANRGTSGIDGSSSTAVGMALSSERLNVLLTGDLAFFYDRNAFWHNYSLPNLCIILLNNHGGGIFKMIDGPARQPELEEYFVTRQALEAENTARDFGMDYQCVRLKTYEDLRQLRSLLPDFYHNASSHARILEIVTDTDTNTEIFRQYRQGLSAYFGK
ncbi:MAG: 2-succinyl-5-enolpyruvyl-6-hydroxy-3-cyclohexene-1-carboxylic-acid synthase [Cyclobacteriaceae bacterium]